MRWKFDIVDLIVAVIISFLLGSLYVVVGVSQPPSDPDLPTNVSSPSSEASEGADLKVGPESGPNAFNAGETNCPIENQYSLSGQLIRVTAYCPCEKCCGRWSDGITASGHKIGKDDKFVAAPLSVPFGTMLIIPGYNNNEPIPVLDRGGVIKGNRLDAFFSTHQEALNWGHKWLNVRFWFERFKG